MKKTLLMLAGLVAMKASAGVLPFGVQVDVQASTVTDEWGWTQCYVTSGISSNIAYSTILNGCNGDSLMMAVRLAGAESYDILGAASFETVTRFTDLTYNTQTLTGNDENGISWYLNNSSWGFTELGNTVNQYTADTNLYFQGWNGQNDVPFNNIGLSYHSNETGLRGGWAFNNGSWTALSSDYERVWLTTNATVFESSVVPEPVGAILLITGLAMLTLVRKRQLSTAKLSK